MFCWYLGIIQDHNENFNSIFSGLCLSSLLLSTNLMIKSNHEICVFNSDVRNWNKSASHGPVMNLNASTHHGSTLNHKRSPGASLDFDEIDTPYTSTPDNNSDVFYNHSNQNNSSKYGHEHSPNKIDVASLNNTTSCPPLPSSLSSDRLSLLLILLYVCFSAVGVIVIPWTMIGELLPGYARGTCSGFLISYGYVWMFLMVKVFPAALDYSMVGTFNAFSVVSFLLAAFVLYCLPETKGKTFIEIESYFSWCFL